MNPVNGVDVHTPRARRASSRLDARARTHTRERYERTRAGHARASRVARRGLASDDDDAPTEHPTRDTTPQRTRTQISILNTSLRHPRPHKFVYHTRTSPSCYGINILLKWIRVLLLWYLRSERFRMTRIYGVNAHSNTRIAAPEKREAANRRRREMDSDLDGDCRVAATESRATPWSGRSI